MNIISLISELAQQDIRLWLDDGNLAYSAPDGAMTPDVIAKLREHKPAIIEFLKQSEQQQTVSFDKAIRGDQNQGYTVSAAQQRLWFLQQLEPENSAYHIHAALSLKGPLDIASLNQACSTIIQRHEILRTHYQQEDGILKQFIQAPEAIVLQAQACDESELQHKIQQHLHQAFDLSANVFRCQLWQTAHEHFALAFTVHHIAADGWSLGLFVNELMALYQSFCEGKTATLPALDYQYIDYAHWQNQAPQQQKQNEQLTYWQETLQGCPNLDLPLDHARQLLADGKAGLVDFRLNAEQTSGLKQLAQQHGGTLFMSLLSSYAVLLQRYSQQADFAIGTPIAGRSVSQLEPMIGCFLNVLAIRCEIDESQTFSDFLQQQIKQCKNAFDHQDLPFERIVNELVSNRDLSQSPLFQTMLSLQNTPFNTVSKIHGLEISGIESPDITAQFDLKLTAAEDDDELHCRFEFKQALFNHHTIEHMAEHFKRLVDLLLSNTDNAINSLDLFASDELQQRLQLHEGGDNDTQKPLPENQLLHVLFEQQVEKTPNAIAVSDKNQSLSYQQLNNRANQLAQQCIKQGLSAESLVGVCSTRSVHMMTALLAVLKSGCAYVPLDPDFPLERLSFMAEDTAINTLLVDENSFSLGQTLAADKLQLITLNDGLFNDAALTENPNINIRNDALFNVIYTSGSTGTPKGVMVPHSGICNRLLWMQNTYPLTSHDKILQKTPYSFDVSVWELFWPIITGSQSYFADAEGHKDPTYLRDIIQSQNITTTHFVPSMLAAFLHTADIEKCSSLRHVFCSGEALQLEHQRRFFERLNNTTLHNLYGPTEASIDVSFYDCQANNDYASVPIGKAIDNTQLHVLDAQLRPLPAGIAGELYIGGTGLAKGYLNQQELTATTFINNPFVDTGHSSEKLYKTGDLVRLSDDGNILYLGRIDHQVKIRGNRIELGEIENTLIHHPDVREAIVTATTSTDGSKQLIAYVLSDTELSTSDLQQTINSKLPAYMQPAAFIQLDAWPLTPSGKINRNKLPQPDWQQLNAQAYIAPETETQKQLAQIWAEVLQLERVGIEDNFFHIGGHSLTATQALAKAQELFLVEVPLREIFENPTISHIASLLDEAILQQSVFSDNATDTEDDEDMETFVL
ncbi:MAG: amino acid adenylation domain-containing protein [Pseudomonadales bacterium]|nr:amino acid adenylation domain-containing protein [Pseudomonadales bacterium]